MTSSQRSPVHGGMAMAQLQVGLPLRLIGYDRKATLALLTSTQDELRRAETQREELASG